MPGDGAGYFKENLSSNQEREGGDYIPARTGAYTTPDPSQGLRFPAPSRVAPTLHRGHRGQGGGIASLQPSDQGCGVEWGGVRWGGPRRTRPAPNRRGPAESRGAGAAAPTCRGCADARASEGASAWQGGGRAQSGGGGGRARTDVPHGSAAAARSPAWRRVARPPARHGVMDHLQAGGVSWPSRPSVPPPPSWPGAVRVPVPAAPVINSRRLILAGPVAARDSRLQAGSKRLGGLRPCRTHPGIGGLGRTVWGGLYCREWGASLHACDGPFVPRLWWNVQRPRHARLCPLGETPAGWSAPPAPRFLQGD